MNIFPKIAIIVVWYSIALYVGAEALHHGHDAPQQDAHLHGHTELMIAIEGSTLEINFDYKNEPGVTPSRYFPPFLHCSECLCIALHCFALSCMSLHCCIAFHCFALLCFALLCIALH